MYLQNDFPKDIGFGLYAFDIKMISYKQAVVNRFYKKNRKTKKFPDFACVWNF